MCRSMVVETSVDLRRILEIRSLGIHGVPTPIDRRIVGRGRHAIWIKRDDRCGFGRGGVKARKIDFLVRDLIDSGRNHVVTLATNVTNLVHDIVPLLHKHGVGASIFVTDDPRMPAPLRLRLFRDVAEEVHLIGVSRCRAVASVGWAAATLRRQGLRPTVVLPSLGHPAAVVGVARGFLEMAGQIRGAADVLPRTLFITTASGVTLAGLVLGNALLRACGAEPVRVVAVPVYSGPVRLYAYALLRWTIRHYGLSLRARLDSVTMTDWREGGDFGLFGAQLIEVCERVSAEHGLLIDPIYGGKTWQVMERMLAEGSVAEPCLYWHCGYTPDWREFPICVR